MTFPDYHMILIALIGILCLAVMPARLNAAVLLPTNLQCEGRHDPLGVDSQMPRLSWQLASQGRGQRQSAYEIVAASTVLALAAPRHALWSSGKVASDETLQIAYRGKALASSQRVYWRVRVWDKDGDASLWSEAAQWTMGVLSSADWKAHWIGAASIHDSILLRRTVDVKPHLVRGLMHVCGLGQYELSVNGHKAGDDVLAPGWTKYDKTCLYDTREITRLLHPGENAVGLMLGNGMYNVHGGRYAKFTGSFGPLQAIGQLRLEYADGTVQIVGTDGTWRVAPGPITFSSPYGGEDYDARLLPRDWDQPSFKDGAWPDAVLLPGPGGVLRGVESSAPPIKTCETFPPVSVKELSPGVSVYDFGQNASLMPRLSVVGPAGSMVRITPAELIHEDGSIDRGSVGGGAAYWQYTLSGNGQETYFPKFFYHGCRYVRVERSGPAGGGLPQIGSLAGVVVQSASPLIGEFSCSSDLFNRAHTLVRWAQRSNMVSILTDCPHRERLGWLEEDHLNGPSLRYEHDLNALFGKTMNDMADSQTPDGLIPDIAPEYTQFDGGFRDSPEWGSAFLLVPWQQYQFTGDLSLLRRYYEPMKRYVAYLGGKSQDHIVSYGLGDWYDIGPNPPGYAQLTPPALTATAFYYQDALILASAARLIDHPADEAQYAALAAQIKTAFNREFFHADLGRYATGSQCANAIPLVLGLAPEASRPAVLAAIVDDVQARGNAFTAGDVGYRYLLRALADGGRSDVIFAMNNQSEKPGYGYQLKMGATSLAEAWDARRNSSQNHFMLGQIVEWFYGDLAGIQPDPSGPGFTKIIIKPTPVGDVNSARAVYRSVRGPISCAWTKTEAAFTLSVSIPPNTTATIDLPAHLSQKIQESGKPVSGAPGVGILERSDGMAVLSIVSGSYHFTVSGD